MVAVKGGAGSGRRRWQRKRVKKCALRAARARARAPPENGRRQAGGGR